MSNKLYIGNIPFAATEDTVAELFAEYNPISINVVNDKATNKSRGFCFIEFEDEDYAKDAMRGLQGADLGGRSIFINVARERAKVKYCCIDMRQHFALINYDYRDRQFNVVDRNSQLVQIHFCPWCGTPLTRLIQDDPERI